MKIVLLEHVMLVSHLSAYRVLSLVDYLLVENSGS